MFEGIVKLITDLFADLFDSVKEDYKIERSDGSTIEVKGYLPTPAAEKSAYKEYVPSAAPPKTKSGNVSAVDLRPHLTHVENQGRVGSCTANAVVGAYEYLAKQHLGEKAWDVSRLFVYYNARAMDDPSDIQDQGSNIGYAVKSLFEHGACSEATWNYNEKMKNARPHDEAYQEGKQFLIESAQQVKTDLNQWKSCLNEGYPIIFGTRLFNSFDENIRGRVAMPKSSELSRKDHGAHAMLCVGYSEKDQLFIVRNSWGTDWGDKGYCYMPYSYLMNEKLNLNDSWMIRQLADFKGSTDDIIHEEENYNVYQEENDYFGGLEEKEYDGLIDGMGDYPLEYRLALLILSILAPDGASDGSTKEGMVNLSLIHI
jgi:C1A family cysteine protease